MHYKAECLHRWKKLSEETTRPVCKKWYGQQAAELLEDKDGLDTVYPQKGKQRTPCLLNSNKDTPETTSEEIQDKQPAASSEQDIGSDHDLKDEEDDKNSFLTPAERAPEIAEKTAPTSTVESEGAPAGRFPSS